MKRNAPLWCALALFGAPAHSFTPSSAGLVNGTGGPLRSVEIRNTPGGSWKDGPTIAQDGAKSAWAFDDSDCAYDIRVTTASGDTIMFKGINPCGAQTLTLRRNAAVGWVDYD
ncbi:MAG: hypothetical protein ABI667_08560 [Sphingomicrobium sp.]